MNNLEFQKKSLVKMLPLAIQKKMKEKAETEGNPNLNQD